MRSSSITSLPPIAAALLLTACHMNAQELRSESFDIVAYDIGEVDVQADTCPTLIGSIAVASRRDEAASFTASSLDPRVVFVADGTELSTVTAEIAPRGRVEIPVALACGPPEILDATIEFALAYQSGVGGSGTFSVQGRAR